MTREETLTIAQKVLDKVKKARFEINEESDLIEEGILDSLDGMVFILELEQATGKQFPPDADLVEEGFYKMSKLIDYLTN
jgi:acyl carrier protein